MINKRISKITMLTCLMLGGIVNAQEFYTCVPKKNTIMNININNVDELAKAITKIGGVGGGGTGDTNTNQKKWYFIRTIDFTKILNDDNLNQQNLLILASTFFSGTYNFKLILKDKNSVVLHQSQTIVTINKNEKLFFDILSYNCMHENQVHIIDFYNKYNMDKVIFLQDRNLIRLPTCKPDYNIGIALLRTENKSLFTYEYISKWPDTKLYDESFVVNKKSADYRWLSEHPLNIFRYSTLEIYKKKDD